MLCCWLRNTFTVKSSGPFFLNDVTPKMRPLQFFEQCDTYPMTQHHIPEDLNLRQSCRLNLQPHRERLLAERHSHNHSRTTKMPKLCCSFSLLSALHLPHQGICHPVLNERPHLYFLRFNLLTALRNVIGPLALSATRREMTLTHHTRINGH